MKTILILVATATTMVLAGCASTKVTKSVAPEVDFQQFQKVQLVVTNSVHTIYALKGLPMFEGLLKGRLQSLGYTMVETDPELVVVVTVHAFDPGNRSLRTLIGFGAGRTELKYTAQFSDAAGKLLTELEGGKSYSGMELNDNPTFKSDEATRMGMITYSVGQIGEFIEHNGRAK